MKIKVDHSRFRQIIRGKIKQNLKKYMSRRDLIAKKGKDRVSIPIPHIEIPRFQFGPKETGGVSQGDGEIGDPIQGEPQQGQGKAGQNPGEHLLETEWTLDELADIMGEELALPRIQPKGQNTLKTMKDKYSGIKRSGPESLRSFKRTYKAALKRMIASGTYDPQHPVIIPIREDRRYRSWKEVPIPQSNAVILYIMDVSGSMGEAQKELVRTLAFWLETWLNRQYDGLEQRYIIHDASAKEVDAQTFFTTRESGGTIISSAYKLCAEIIEKEYSPELWNIYVFQFSDGDNWSKDDTKLCMELLKEKLLPPSNMFAYGQVHSPYGSGQFIKDLEQHFPDEERLVTTKIADMSEIYQAIKTFLGKGY